MKKHEYFVYITTNPSRTVLYIGVTNNLKRRLQEHSSTDDFPKSFAQKYHCYCLIYFENFNYINDAIARETELKKWSRRKKEELIGVKNPCWKFLNGEIV